MEFSPSEPLGICWLDTDTQRVFYLILVYVFDPALIFSICICIKKKLFSSPDNIWHISSIWLFFYFQCVMQTCTGVRTIKLIQSVYLNPPSVTSS